MIRRWNGMGWEGVGRGTHGYIVKRRQQEENTKNRNDTQEHAAHGRPPTRRRRHFTPSVPAERGQRHERASQDIRGPESHELAVRAERDVLDAVRGPGAQTLGGDRGLEEAEQGNDKGRAQRGFEVAEVREVKGELRGEGAAGRRAHVA